MHIFMCSKKILASSFITSTEFKYCYCKNIYDETLCTSFIGYLAGTCGLHYWLDQITSGAEASYEIL